MSLLETRTHQDIDVRPARPRRWLDSARIMVRDNIVALMIGALLLYLVGAPLIFLVRMSFGSGTSPTDFGSFTTSNYARAFSSTEFSSVMWNTAVYAVGVSVISLGLAVMMAWLIERTDLPMRGFAWILILLPIAMPGFLSSMAYTLLFSPKAGVGNQVIRDLLQPLGYSADSGPFNIFSMEGMIFVEGIRGTTTVFLMIVGAMRLMDPSLEDAATMSGSDRFESLRRITVPLLVPALLGAAIYSFVGNLQDFDTPLVLGLPGGVFILPTYIYFVAYSSSTPGWGLASAYASLFIVMMIVFTYLYFRVAIRGSKRFATVLGKGYRPQRIKLGSWKYPAVGLFAIYGFFSIGLPFFVLLWTSLAPSSSFRIPNLEMLRNMDFSAYSELAQNNGFLKAITNTVGISLLAAVATMAVALLSSWAVVRLRVRGAALLDTMAFIPNAIPAIALGVALVMFYLSPVGQLIPIYGTWALLVIAFVVNYIAYATRVSNGGMVQLGAELEEASWLAGHGKLSTLFRVTTPLLLPTFLAGALWVFAHSARNLTLPLLLGSRKSETVSMYLWRLWDINQDFRAVGAIGVIMIVLIGGIALAARNVMTRRSGDG